MESLAYLKQILAKWKASRYDCCNTFPRLEKCIAELEALQQYKSCEGCKYRKFGATSIDIEEECILIWKCARANGFPDRYEPKE